MGKSSILLMQRHMECIERETVREFQENPQMAMARFLEERARASNSTLTISSVIAVGVALMSQAAAWGMASLSGLASQGGSFLASMVIIYLFLAILIPAIAIICIAAMARDNARRKALVEYKERIMREHEWWS